MIDALLVVRRHILSYNNLATLFTGGIVSGPDLPEGYSVLRGPSLVINTRGGNLGYHNDTLQASLQLRIFAETFDLSIRSAGDLFDAINDSRGLGIKWLRLEEGTIPTSLTDPLTGWPFVMMFFSAVLFDEKGV